MATRIKHTFYLFGDSLALLTTFCHVKKILFSIDIMWGIWIFSKFLVEKLHVLLNCNQIGLHSQIHSKPLIHFDLSPKPSSYNWKTISILHLTMEKYFANARQNNSHLFYNHTKQQILSYIICRLKKYSVAFADHFWA